MKKIFFVILPLTVSLSAKAQTKDSVISSLHYIALSAGYSSIPVNPGIYLGYQTTPVFNCNVLSCFPFPSIPKLTIPLELNYYNGSVNVKDFESGTGIPADYMNRPGSWGYSNGNATYWHVFSALAGVKYTFRYARFFYGFKILLGALFTEPPQISYSGYISTSLSAHYSPSSAYVDAIFKPIFSGFLKFSFGAFCGYNLNYRASVTACAAFSNASSKVFSNYAFPGNEYLLGIGFKYFTGKRLFVTLNSNYVYSRLLCTADYSYSFNQPSKYYYALGLSNIFFMLGGGLTIGK